MTLSLPQRITITLPLLTTLLLTPTTSFAPRVNKNVLPFAKPTTTTSPYGQRRSCSGVALTSTAPSSSSSTDDDSSDEWTGDVVSGGAMKGCTITSVPGSLTSFTITIDGVEADLGEFSKAVFRKVTSDAKRQSFQGFRPGTIPPHLLPTYKAFAMDEVAREAVMEALQQNNIRPFEASRSDMELKSFSFAPPVVKKKKKKRKKKKKGQVVVDEPVVAEEEEEVTPAWLVYDNMDDALTGGWEPGQTFSFVATNVKGQKLAEGASGASPIGSGGSAFDINAEVASSLSSDKNSGGTIY